MSLKRGALLHVVIVQYDPLYRQIPHVSYTDLHWDCPVLHTGGFPCEDATMIFLFSEFFGVWKNNNSAEKNLTVSTLYGTGHTEGSRFKISCKSLILLPCNVSQRRYDIHSS